MFISDPGFKGVFAGYGFEEYYVNMSAPMPPEAMAKYWSDFINGHISNFTKAPIDQIDNYVKECWGGDCRHLEVGHRKSCLGSSRRSSRI